jgi:SAM-dependent methyltransferase
MSDRWRDFDLVEAFQLSHAVDTLHRLGLLTALKQPATADELSAQYSLDPNLLRGILEFVATQTDLLRKSGQHFVTTRKYSEGSRFLLDLYVGAYGGNAAQLATLLRKPSLANGAVDKVRHAKAFAAVDGSSLGVLPEIICQLGLNHVLDLGCGNGALLLELAVKNSAFAGWGIDLNPAMCKTARARIRAAGYAKRVRVIAGDCTTLGSALPTKVRSMVRAVTACQVANELFAEGHSRVIAWLQSMRKVLPGRPLLIADYYGTLGQKEAKRGKKSARREQQSARATLLHDYAQLISGQGVPPATAAEWRSIYARAGCSLVHIIEDKTTTRFIHFVRL